MTPHPLAERAFAGLCAYSHALAFDAPDDHSPAKWGQMILVVVAVALPFYAVAPVPVWKQALLFAWPFVFVFTFKMGEAVRRTAKQSDRAVNTATDCPHTTPQHPGDD